MISYAGTPLQVPSAQEGAWINSRIPLAEAFGFFRAKSLGNLTFNPRAHLAWILSRAMKLNALFVPWGASRWSYAICLADGNMLKSINTATATGTSQAFTIDDGLGSAVTTQLFALPAVPLSKIMNVNPQLPLSLLVLVDERYRWWERAATSVTPPGTTSVDVTEGTTTWLELYAALALALGITLNVDPVMPAYLFPSYGFTAPFQHLPLLLDLCASSVGQRIVRNLDGSFNARNAISANALVVSQANLNRKLAGGSLDLGAVNA